MTSQNIEQAVPHFDRKKRNFTTWKIVTIWASQQGQLLLGHFGPRLVRKAFKKNIGLSWDILSLHISVRTEKCSEGLKTYNKVIHIFDFLVWVPTLVGMGGTQRMSQL